MQARTKYQASQFVSGGKKIAFISSNGSFFLVQNYFDLYKSLILKAVLFDKYCFSNIMPSEEEKELNK